MRSSGRAVRSSDSHPRRCAPATARPRQGSGPQQPRRVRRRSPPNSCRRSRRSRRPALQLWAWVLRRCPCRPDRRRTTTGKCKSNLWRNRPPRVRRRARSRRRKLRRKVRCIRPRTRRQRCTRARRRTADRAGTLGRSRCLVRTRPCRRSPQILHSRRTRRSRLRPSTPGTLQIEPCPSRLLIPMSRCRSWPPTRTRARRWRSKSSFRSYLPIESSRRSCWSVLAGPQIPRRKRSRVRVLQATQVLDARCSRRMKPTTRSVSGWTRAPPREVWFGWEPPRELGHSVSGCDVG